VRPHPKYVRLSSGSTINATEAIAIPEDHRKTLTELHGEESAKLREAGYL
jgi:hypothetical protein